jgi:hypothetical protein
VLQAPDRLQNLFCAFLSLLLPFHTFTVKFASSLLHPISHLSWYRIFKTLTRRWFIKTAITLRSELEIGQFFLKLGRIKFCIHPSPTKSGFPMRRGPNLTSKASNSKPGWCFKFHAESCGISIAHTFCLIELKICVLPILVIQNQKK